MALYGRVERPECIACGLCQMLAPALFDYDEAGIAYYKPDRNTGTSHWMIMQKLIFGLRISVARHMPSNAVTTRLTRLRLRQLKRNNQA